MGLPRAVLLLTVLASAGSDVPAVWRTSPLTFEERVRAQEAIERVYHAHRLGGPGFERTVPRRLLEEKVDRALRLSAALEEFWSTPVTAAALDRELARIASATHFPDRLAAIYEALDRDPVLIRETLARATLVDRLARSFFENDDRIHAGSTDPIPFEIWWEEVRDRFPASPRLAPGPASAHLPAIGSRGTGRPGSTLHDGDQVPDCGLTDAWAHGRGFGEPPGRSGATSVWTGSEMIIWGGDNLNVGSSGGRYDPLTDVWRQTSLVGAPSQRNAHTAVWTGTEMIVWGGGGGGTPSNTGARYNPVTDAWTPTTLVNAPPSRRSHTAVWTGHEMIVWGGWNFTNTGGRYDPVTDTWTSTSVVGAPAARQEHLAVWTGREMIVWGGGLLRSGGRYDPATDSWAPTSETGTPPGRGSQSVVWTGTEMIIWGGSSGGTQPAGGRYNPVTDTWTPTSMAGAPDNRAGHTGVWTGARMIVWGGASFSPTSTTARLNSGGIYDPANDTWIPTTLVNAPAARSGHTGIWADGRLIVWGGTALGGGRYDPAADSWTPTSTGSPVPTPRTGHTTIWTGSEMIVWGGAPGPVGTGARWDALTDDWRRASTIGAPGARQDHSAVWTGTEMIVWGGVRADSPDNELADGGRYDPASDTWAPVSPNGVPAARRFHSAVWTGAEMIVWGGDTSYFIGGEAGDGGRYDPAADAWAGMSSLNAPAARASHAAVWTGTEMIVAGGNSSGTPGRYDPATDTWTPTSAPGAPTAIYPTAVWTGSEVIVWGGNSGVSTGARYDPTADAWTPTSTTGAPEGRVGHAAVWTGREMIVWGGIRFQGLFLPIINHLTGGRYDPATGTWTPTSVVDAPRARFAHTLIWTGGAVIPWGGSFFSGDVEAQVTQGQVSWYGGGPLPPPDEDADGFSVCDGDCDDADPLVHPGAVDRPGDRRDEDCRAGPLCDPGASWRNHGAFVSCVARECNRLVAAGDVSLEECSRILAGAARSNPRRTSRR